MTPTSNQDDNDANDPVLTPENYGSTPESRQTITDLSTLMEVSPVKFQVTKPVEDLKPSTFRYLKKKILEVQEEAVKKAMENVAPGQGTALQKVLFPLKADNNIPDDLRSLLAEFHKANHSNEKLAILSLIPFKIHAKSEIM